MIPILILTEPPPWPYLLGGMVAHLGFLLLSYNKGDLTQVYRIARGSVPLIVTAVSAFALGVRASGSPMGFYAWLGLANAVIFAGYLWVKDKTVLRRTFTHGLRVFSLGHRVLCGICIGNLGVYTQAPITRAKALRETSIVFALLIGVLFFKERFDTAKILTPLLFYVVPPCYGSGAFDAYFSLF